MNITKSIKSNKIFLIVILGLAVRFLFTLFFADLFYNRPNIFVDGDTQAWAISFQNLFETGSYTINPGHEYGYFGRMPGYSFFIGIFWLFIGNWDHVFPVVGWFQIFLDTISIFLVYRIAQRIFKNDSTALFASLLYALYPFIIVWNPVVYSECTSVFLMLFSLYHLLQKKPVNTFWSGLLLGLGILFRPQLLFLLPVYIIAIFISEKRILSKSVLLFVFAILITYGVWPLRNIAYHNKVILTQDLRGMKNWNADVLSFMQYTYSVKAEWEPQFSSIIKNTPTTWPKESYRTKNDSLLLDHAVILSKNCGSGFSFWKGYWKNTVEENNSCTKEVSTIFNYLRNNQIIYNSINYYLIVPFSNLKKAVFKSALYNAGSSVGIIASLLFYYRTILILSGLLGIILMAFRKHYYYLIFISFFLLLYGTLCWGGTPQMRNIEIRYFIHADILLLFPAAFLIRSIFEKINLHMFLKN